MSSSKQRSPYAKQIRTAHINTTANEPQPNAMFKQCTVFSCALPTQAHAGKGLSERYCAKHVRHLSRHGSAHCNSYKASDMKPYIWATERWLKVNQDVSLVKRIIVMFDALLNGAGKPEITSRMLRAPAKDKAKVALARMRVRGIKPIRLLTITLATRAIVADDQTFSHRGNEFLHVQIARQAHRLAARYVPKGKEDVGFGDKIIGGLKWGHQTFPAGTGIALRILGVLIDDIGSHLADKAVPSIIELKRTRFGKHASRQAPQDVAQRLAS
jgi:hypothetical protein